MKQSGEKDLSGQSLREFLAADMAFHTLLIHAAGNPADRPVRAPILT